jgi:hypothetical protein
MSFFARLERSNECGMMRNLAQTGRRHSHLAMAPARYDSARGLHEEEVIFNEYTRQNQFYA